MKLYVYTLREDPFIFEISNEDDLQKLMDWWINADGKNYENIGLIGSTLIRRESIMAMRVEE